MALNLPVSDSTVSVSIVDSTFLLTGAPVAIFMGPAIPGFETFTAGAFAFLVTHKDASSGAERKVVFDLGPPKDWQNDLPPPVAETISGWMEMGAKVSIEKYVSEILEEEGVDLEGIEAVIWSHPHWDHIGRPSLFPPSTKLIVGPGLKDTFAPGFPDIPDSPILAREFSNREVVQISFSDSSPQIGGLRALNFFGDGSFYLLDAPGHAVGHINALARTSTSPDTFIYMGADSFHHGSQLRPNEHTHLPGNLELPKSPAFAFPSPCPGELFHQIHPSMRQKTEPMPTYAKFLTSALPEKSPLHTISQKEDGSSLAVDVDAARDVIAKIQAFDADENVFVIAAHDESLREVLEYFPAEANKWKGNGWKEKGRWRFLADLGRAVALREEGK